MVANWAYIGVEEEGAAEAASREKDGLYSDVGLLAFAMCKGSESSLESSDSTLRILGRCGGGRSAAAATDEEYIFWTSVWVLALLP